MPQRIHDLLVSSAHGESELGTSRLVHALHRLLEEDTRIAVAYLCNESVQHVGKLNGEGSSFCAYHNMQMLCSCLRNTENAVSRFCANVLPSIFQIQDQIEREKGSNLGAKFLWLTLDQSPGLWE